MNSSAQIDGFAIAGDHDALWRSVKNLVFAWAVYYKKGCGVPGLDIDDLVGDASVKFMVATKTWKPGRPFVPYLKALVYRDWHLTGGRAEQKRKSAHIDRLPADRRAKFGLPDGRNNSVAFFDTDESGGIAGNMPNALGEIAVWNDRDDHYDDAHVCDELLGQLNAEDAAILREYMYQSSERGGPQLGGAMMRARKILKQPGQKMLY